MSPPPPLSYPHQLMKKKKITKERKEKKKKRLKNGCTYNPNRWSFFLVVIVVLGDRQSVLRESVVSQDLCHFFIVTLIQKLKHSFVKSLFINGISHAGSQQENSYERLHCVFKISGTNDTVLSGE